MYTPLVYDVRPSDHNSLSVLGRLGMDEYARLRAFYKFELDTTYGYDRAQPGELFWGVAGIELKAGPAIVQPQVQDQDGAPLSDILLAFHWPGAPSVTMRIVATGTKEQIEAKVKIAIEAFKAQKFWVQVAIDPQYYGNAVFGWTDADGTVGWGYSSEGHIGDDGGPFAVWPMADPPTASDRRVGSDCLKKIGFWDDHITPNPIFQVMRKEGTQPPPTDGDTYLVDIDANGNIVKRIRWIPGAPGSIPASGNGSLGLWQDDQVIAHIPWAGGPPVAPQGVFAQIGRLLRGL